MGKSNDLFQNHVVNTQDTLVEEIEHAEVDGKIKRFIFEPRCEHSGHVGQKRLNMPRLMGKSNDLFLNHVVNTQDTLVEEIEHAEVDGKIKRFISEPRCEHSGHVGRRD